MLYEHSTSVECSIKPAVFQLSFNLLTQRGGRSQNRAVSVLSRSPEIFHLLEIFYPLEYMAYLLITVIANNHIDTQTHRNLISNRTLIHIWINVGRIKLTIVYANHKSWYSVTKHCSSLVCNIQYCHTQPSHVNITWLSRTLGHDSENTNDNSENIHEDGTWHNEFLVRAAAQMKRKKLYFHSRVKEIQESHILSNVK